MKQTLFDEDRHLLDQQISTAEKHTNTQIVLALIQRSDSYAELPWKAFALGASFSGLLVFILDVISFNWGPGISVIAAIAGILAGGAVFAFLTVLIPGIAKLFLSPFRAEVEVEQYAKSLFLSRELFATSKRTGILLLVSLFERKVVILPDKGLRDHLSEEKMQGIITAMTPFLKRVELRQAFESGLAQLVKILGTTKPGKNENELSDEIIEENGV
jgi:putative membrane protein